MKGFHTNVVKRTYKMLVEREAIDGTRTESMMTVEAESESAAMLMVPEDALFIEFIKDVER